MKKMTKDQKRAIIENARKNNWGYPEVAKKLGVESGEVDGIIDELFDKVNERKQVKKSFKDNTKTETAAPAPEEVKEQPKQAEQPVESPLVEETIEEIGEVTQENLDEWIYRLVKTSEDCLADLNALEKGQKDFEAEGRKEIEQIRTILAKTLTDVDKKKEEFVKEINKLATDRINLAFKRINELEEKISGNATYLKEYYELNQSEVAKIRDENKRVYDELEKSRKVQIPVDLGTGVFIAPKGKDVKLVDEATYKKYYYELVDSNDCYDLTVKQLKIIARAKAILANRGNIVIEFVDTNGKPLPARILRAING